MTYNQLKQSLRVLWRNRLYTTLNVAGLALGMASAMLIALWVQNELRYDRYHRRADSIWRITTDLKLGGDEIWHWGTTPLRISELTGQVPGILSVSRTLNHNRDKLNLHRGVNIFQVEKFAYVDPQWFETFDYEFVEGSPAGFFDNPNQLMLTEQTARKIFGAHSALGAVLRIDTIDYTVHAVLKNPRSESSFQETLLMPLEAHLRKDNNRRNDESWGNFNYSSFVELQADADPHLVAGQLTRLLREVKKDSNITLNLLALRDLHFDRSLEHDVFEKGNMSSVLVFGLIGLLILLMAAVNYISLSTARAGMRARETGIHKVVGAGKMQLFGRYMTESGLVALFAGVVALLLMRLALPAFNALADNHFTMEWNSPLLWIIFGGALFGTLACAGVYPALVLAAGKPVSMLRSQSPVGSGANPALRRVLVVSQFVISVGLLACTMVIAKQRAFILHSDLGLDRAQVFSFEFKRETIRQLGLERSVSVKKALAEALRQSSAVAGVSLSDQLPIDIKSSHSGSVKYEGMAPDAEPVVSQSTVDADYGPLMGLRMESGRWFEAGNETDHNNVILNETAVRKLGIRQPAVGQWFEFHGTRGQIVGVVRDFHFLPLTDAVTPLVLYRENSFSNYFLVKSRPGATAQALAAAEQVWKRFVPDLPFESVFLDEKFEKQYRRETRAGLLFNIFAGIAMFISCLGLFGLATFMAVQRTKEIGVRKVLGASVAGVVALLTRDFLKLVFIAVVLATPIAWYLMRQWLTGFAYRIELNGWMFAGAGAAALLVAALTVSVQSIRAALANPVKSLRQE